MSVNEQIFDFQVAQQIRWLRLGRRTIAEILGEMTKLDTSIERLLRSSRLGEGTFRRRQLEAMRSQIADLQRSWHNGTLRPWVTRTVDEVRDLASRGEVSMLRRAVTPVLRDRGGVGATIDVVTPNTGALNALADPGNLRNMINGSTLSEWLDQLRENDVRRTWRRIGEGVLAGETTDDLVRGVIGSRSLRYRDGVRQVSRNGVSTLVRTATNHAQNAGRQLVWEANQDLIKGVQWVSTLDTRTTPICRDRDGKVYGVEEGPRPPAHPNCRSTTIPITKSWEELGLEGAELSEGTRASMNGQVPRSLNYYEWLNRQSANVQREAVGPTRFRMWKEQGIRPERFYRDDGHTYSLQELRQRLGSDVAGMSVGQNFDTAALARSLLLTDDGVAVYRARVGDIMPEDIGRMLLGNLDELEDVTVDFASEFSDRAAVLSIRARRGSDIALNRRIDFNSRTAHHDMFELSPDLQNRRIGRRLLAAQINAYQRLGIERVELLANIDVGSYAWARYGFRPSRIADFRDQVRGRLNMLAFENGFDNTAELYKDVMRAINSPEPAWMVSDLRQLVIYEGRRVPLGKALLLDLRWPGHLDLSDVSAMTRFHDYVR